MGFKYTKVEYPFRTETDESYDYLKLPYEDNGGKKVLFVLDYVPSDDLASGRLLAGTTGDLLGEILRHTKKLYAKNLKDFSWFAVNYNCFRTIGKTPEYVAQAKEEFTERLRMIVCKYKPDVVITFGRDATNALIPDKIQLSGGKFSPWLGLNVPATIRHRKKMHETQVCSNISLNTIVTGESGPAGILGYMMRCLANGLQGNKYLVDSARLDAHKSITIDSLKKFDRLLDEVTEAECVSVDTETRNLTRITNRLLTIQFATEQDRGYMIPFYHKDTPFSRKELDYMKDRLKNYFEGDNQNEYHIYANAQFDLSVIKNQLDVRYYANNLWDIFGAEFCFHPDTLVVTELGMLRIGDLIKMDVPPRVLSYNHKTGETEYEEILLTSEHETSEEMYEVEYEGGTLRVTGNHKVWSVTRNAYVRVDEIGEGEEILVLA